MEAWTKDAVEKILTALKVSEASEVVPVLNDKTKKTSVMKKAGQGARAKKRKSANDLDKEAFFNIINYV